jgi:hypothetical protein
MIDVKQTIDCLWLLRSMDSIIQAIDEIRDGLVDVDVYPNGPGISKLDEVAKGIRNEIGVATRYLEHLEHRDGFMHHSSLPPHCTEKGTHQYMGYTIDVRHDFVNAYVLRITVSGEGVDNMDRSITRIVDPYIWDKMKGKSKNSLIEAMINNIRYA